MKGTLCLMDQRSKSTVNASHNTHVSKEEKSSDKIALKTRRKVYPFLFLILKQVTNIKHAIFSPF